MSGASLNLEGSADKTKANWTPTRDAYLVELLTDQQNAGKRSDTGWKKEAWASVIGNFNERFALKYTVPQCKSRLSQLKSQYNTVKKLTELSGFGWDDVLHVVVASDEVWEKYIEVQHFVHASSNFGPIFVIGKEFSQA